ncbi:hypothetical protein DRO66_08070 [Candidatus Bathyarchaeota archaeon]|nr:MAG: hypothetical protein DRO66_08070 [Candidatus Bathyarchaeota archaeon]
MAIHGNELGNTNNANEPRQMDTGKPREITASKGKAANDQYAEYVHAMGLANSRSGFEISNRVGSLLHAFTGEESDNSGLRYQNGANDGFRYAPIRTGSRLKKSDGSTYEVVKTWGDEHSPISYTIKHEQTGKEYYRSRQGLEQAINENKIMVQ